jgi:DNA ligase-1
MEQEALDLGHEGLIVRRPDGRYKQNRSTLKEGLLIKVARRLTSEAEVIGFKEMMHNNNEAFLNEVGYTKRSKHQENLVGTGMLGAFVVRDLKTGVEFDLGNGEGLDHAARKAFWSRRLFMLGSLVKYSYKPYGTKNKPRQPLWLGPRSPDDM